MQKYEFTLEAWTELHCELMVFSEYWIVMSMVWRVACVAAPGGRVCFVRCLWTWGMESYQLEVDEAIVASSIPCLPSEGTQMHSYCPRLPQLGGAASLP